MPAQSAPSASSTNTPAVDHALAPLRLGSFTYGELAVAICAAGIPGKENELSVDQLKSLAIAGVIRLGLAEVHRLNAESRAANLSCCAKLRHDASADVRAEESVIRRIWGSARREQTAVNLGWRLGRDLTDRR